MSDLRRISEIVDSLNRGDHINDGELMRLRDALMTLEDAHRAIAGYEPYSLVRTDILRRLEAVEGYARARGLL